MTKAQLDSRALMVMNRMHAMGVPRCEATEEVVVRVILKPHGRIFVHKTEEKILILVKTWKE